VVPSLTENFLYKKELISLLNLFLLQKQFELKHAIVYESLITTNL